MQLRKTIDGRFLLEHIPSSGVQKISKRAVQAGVAAGTHTITPEAIVLHTSNLGDVAFNITLAPGRHCLHCGHHIAEDPTGAQMRAHIEAEHSGQASPDPNHPAGYLAIEYYLTKVQSDG